MQAWLNTSFIWVTLTVFSRPVIDGLWRGFDMTLQCDIGAAWCPH